MNLQQKSLSLAAIDTLVTYSLADTRSYGTSVRRTPAFRLLFPEVVGKVINTIKSIGLTMVRTIHYVAYICKIGKTERDVIVEISTNNDEIFTECQRQCDRQCIFNKRLYKLKSKSRTENSGSPINKT